MLLTKPLLFDVFHLPRRRYVHKCGGACGADVCRRMLTYADVYRWIDLEELVALVRGEGGPGVVTRLRSWIQLAARLGIHTGAVVKISSKKQ